MYYIWTVKSSYPQSCWLEYDWDNNPDYLQFLENKEIAIPGNSILFNLNKKTNLKTFLGFDYLMSDAVSLISQKLASIIFNIAPKDVQLIKASVHQNDIIIGTYFIPVFLRVIDCIDKENSIYDSDLDDYTKIIFKSKSLGEKLIVKAKGYEDNYPVVQEIFVNQCKFEGIEGIDFIKEPFFNPLYNPICPE